MQKNSTSDDLKTTNNHEPLMTVKDVADYLKVSRSWVYQHAASGQLPYRKIGGNLRFLPHEIRAWTHMK